MIFSIALYYFLNNDNQLIPIEGVALLAGLCVFLFILIRSAKKDKAEEVVDENLSKVSGFRISIWLLIGAAALYFGSDWLVDGAKEIARSLGVSEAVISVTMIAIGTSVPELAASVIAAAKKEKAISLGNLIGSNIFNIGSVLGITSIIKTIPVTAPEILSRDIFWMIAFSAILIPLIFIPRQHQISRYKGFLLVFAYSIFIVSVFTA